MLGPDQTAGPGLAHGHDGGLQAEAPAAEEVQGDGEGVVGRPEEQHGVRGGPVLHGQRGQGLAVGALPARLGPQDWDSIRTAKRTQWGGIGFVL